VKRLIPLLGLLAAMPALAASSLVDRLNETYLSSLQKDVRPYRQAAGPIDNSGDWLDIRAVLHCHSGLSHDSRGTVEQLIAAAKKNKVRAIFMTEHPTADRKWVTEGLRGEKEGVLFIPGAEVSAGMNVWRDDGTRWTPGMTVKEILERQQGTPGIGFIAHSEQRKDDADWDLPPFAGMEIYNTHADAEDSDYAKLGAQFTGKNSLKAYLLVQTLKKYPRESFAAIFDEQTPVLKRWDSLNEKFLGTGRHVVGIAGNDSHQNVGVTITAEETELVVTDGLGKTVQRIDKAKVPALLFGDLKAGTVVLTHQFDPYESSLGYVNTHLLAKEVTEDALFDALLKGRAYVSFDWMADPSGFVFQAQQGNDHIPMGGDASLAAKPNLFVQAREPAEIRLLRNGVEIKREEKADKLSFEPTEPGVYRAEAWFKLPATGESRPWIYSNPIYVRE
jgi:hypothetical protein